MSDRVTNAEVEDVLSSIRRLVSQKNKPDPDASTPVATQQAAAGKLVLTPQLRVDSPSGGTDTAPPSPSLESLVTDDTPLDVYTEANIKSAVDADEEALVTAAEADPSVNSETSASEADEDIVVETQPKQELGFEGTPEEIAADSAEPEDTADISSDTAEKEGMALDEPDLEVNERSEDLDAQDPSQDVKAAALSAKIAALETAIGKISDTWEPDEVGESDYAGTQAQAMTWEDEVAEAKPGQKPLLAPVSRRLSDAEPEVEDTDIDVDDEYAPAFQAFTSQRKSQPRPQILEDQNEVESADLPVEQPSAEPIMEAASAEDVDAEVETLAAEDHLLDEEALRDLISEIVRSELQGALGERITRNVRKLVRREINRALAAQELE